MSVPSRLLLGTPVDSSRAVSLPMKGCARQGYTVVELLVTCAVVVSLSCLTLAAVQSARESARRVQCGANLRQIGVAVQEYLDAQGGFPPGNGWGGFSAHTALLPHLEQEAVYRQLDVLAVRRSAKNLSIEATRIPSLLCPSDGALACGTNYVGNFGFGLQAYGLNGIMRPIVGLYLAGENPDAPYTIRAADVTDGMSNTAAFSETRIGNGARDRLRTLWRTSSPLFGAKQLASFAAACASVDVSAEGSRWCRGFR